MSRYNNSLYNRYVSYDGVKKARYYESLIDPNIPVNENDIYVITTVGDRLDLLAYNYYGDATMWWMIADANPTLSKGSLFLEAGLQLRIPYDSQSVLNLMANQNLER